MTDNANFPKNNVTSSDNSVDSSLTGGNGSLTQDDKAAMRAYLQRAEVRLSTMHRVAGAFLSGAGLLFLVPVFLRDAFVRIFAIVSANIYDRDWQYAAVLFMLVVTLGVPLWSLYLLIKDMVLFYFTAYHAGIIETFFHPRFILSGITFSPDESPTVRKNIIDSQHSIEMRRFIVPQDKKDREYFGSIFAATGGQIIPKTRRGFEYANDEEKEDIELFYTAFGLTGVIDRNLVEEVAKMEMSLVRHAFNLRHLVLRYAKALVMFLLTTILLIITAEVISIPGIKEQKNTIRDVLTLSFLCWAFLMPLVIRRPITWVYRSAEARLSRIRGDRQLIFFERIAIFSSIIVFLIASLSLLIENFDSIDKVVRIMLALAGSAVFGSYWLLKSFNEGRNVPLGQRKQYNEELPENALPPTITVPRTDSHHHSYNLTKLINGITNYFSDGELNTLCTQLRVDYDSLAGQGKSAKSRELIGYLDRRGRILDLVETLKDERPNVDWEGMKS